MCMSCIFIDTFYFEIIFKDSQRFETFLWRSKFYHAKLYILPWSVHHTQNIRFCLKTLNVWFLLHNNNIMSRLWFASIAGKLKYIGNKFRIQQLPTQLLHTLERILVAWGLHNSEWLFWGSYEEYLSECGLKLESAAAKCMWRKDERTFCLRVKQCKTLKEQSTRFPCSKLL